MNVLHVCKWCVASTLLALGLSFGLNQFLFAQAGPADVVPAVPSPAVAVPGAPSAAVATPAAPGPADAEQGVQVLTRGPVHEAFAETVTFDPEPGLVTPKAPPAAIEEVPPEQRLEGANVAWIPGYWAWDDDRNDYLWVSGIWRALPPNRQWVPGYWSQSAQGFQWTSGYWADAKMAEVEYLPEPPATVEAGPNIEATSADQTWMPGCWVWQNSRYAWRPGFWAAAQPNWDWVPAHYVWAPRGYVYVDGYWDYSVGRRGVLFAPVYFDRNVYAQQGFSYTPSTVIDLGVFASHLFLRPRYQHYYFGDYYGANYRGAGFFPRYAFHANRFGYDPIYARDRWQHRQDRGWEQRQQANFENFRDHENLRPPRTWAAQRAMGQRVVVGGETNPVVGLPLDDFRRGNRGPLRFQPVDPSERQQFSQRAQEVQRLRDQRQKLETGAVGAPTAARTGTVAPARVRLPGSPIVAKPVTGLGKRYLPPKTYVAPNPDLTVTGKPRVNRSLGQAQQHTVNRMPLDQTRTPSKAQRQTRQPKPQNPNLRSGPKSQPQTQIRRSAPQRQPQPQVRQQAPRSRGNASSGSKQEQSKDKGKK